MHELYCMHLKYLLTCVIPKMMHITRKDGPNKTTVTIVNINEQLKCSTTL